MLLDNLSVSEVIYKDLIESGKDCMRYRSLLG